MKTVSSYRALFYQTWESLKDNLVLVVGLTATVLILGFMLTFIPLVGGLLTGSLYLGYLHCLVKLSRSRNAEWTDLFYFYTNLARFIQALVLGAIVQVGTIVGFILLIIPGVWFVVATMYANAIFVLEGALDGVSAVRKSLATVKGVWWNHAGLLVFIGFLNMVGALFFLVGLLVTIPVSALMLVEVISPLKVIPPDGAVDPIMDSQTADQADQLKLF
jgi:hypothetical protein